MATQETIYIHLNEFPVGHFIINMMFYNIFNILKDPLHALTDANVLVLVDTDRMLLVNGRCSLPSDIHRSIMYAYHR